MTHERSSLTILLAIFLAVAITMQPVICRAKSMTDSSCSVAVQPFLDGDDDDESKDVAEALTSVLRLMTSHSIVDSNTADKIIAYKDAAQKTKGKMGKAARLLASAKEHYFSFNYRRATQDIDSAISMLTNMHLNTETGPVLLDAYISKALIAKSNKEEADALMALKGAFFVNPLLELSHHEYPPSLVALAEKVRSDVAAAAKGSLRVKSSPHGADVFLNGIRQGVTPLELGDLPQGNYSLRISANRYQPYETDITVLSNEDMTIRSRLKWVKGHRTKADLETGDGASEAVGKGLDLAKALKVDRLILVDADAKGSGALKISARTIDAELGTGLKPVILSKVNPEYMHNRIAEMAAKLADQLDADLLKDPARMIDPLGQGDPVLLSKRKKPLMRRPLFWGAIGVAVAGAIAGGIAAAMSGGSNRGTVRVSFE